MTIRNRESATGRGSTELTLIRRRGTTFAGSAANPNNPANAGVIIDVVKIDDTSAEALRTGTVAALRTRRGRRHQRDPLGQL